MQLPCRLVAGLTAATRWRRRLATAPAVDGRRLQVERQALAVLQALRDEGQPAQYVGALEPFLALAPEVLALGPAPASLTMRLLYGLCAFRGEASDRFLETLRPEFAAPSPTLRAVLRSDLVALDASATPRVTKKGRRLYQALVRAGAFS